MAMRLRRWMLVSATLVLLPIGGCETPDPEPESAGASAGSGMSAVEAADEYRRLETALGQDLLDACKNVKGLEMLDDGTIALLRERRTAIEDLVVASRAGVCDFGADYSEGMQTLLPHLAVMRRMMWALCIDAMRAAKDGDQNAAAERLAAVVRMSRHCAGSDPVMVGKVVAFSGLAVVGGIVDELGVDYFRDEAARRILLAELHAIDLNDPFDAIGALPAERDAVLISIRKVSGSGSNRQVADPRYSREACDAAIEELPGAFAQMEAVWFNPNAAADIERIVGGLSSTPARQVAAGLAPYRRQVERTKENLEELIAALEP